MSDMFISTPDHQEGKVLKYFRPNPIGEDVYLGSDGVTVTRDEDKIIKVQRIFKHFHYKPGGRGAQKVIGRLLETNSCRVFTARSDDDDALLGARGGHARVPVAPDGTGVGARHSGPSATGEESAPVVVEHGQHSPIEVDDGI